MPRAPCSMLSPPHSISSFQFPRDALCANAAGKHPLPVVKTDNEYILKKNEKLYNNIRWASFN
jgi:hypothetical protein